MFSHETSHQIATDGESTIVYRLCKDGEHICDASYSGGAYIDLGTYYEGTGEFEARECVNVYNYALGKSEITNSVGQVEEQAFEFLFDEENMEDE